MVPMIAGIRKHPKIAGAALLTSALLLSVGCASLGPTAEHADGKPYHHLVDGFRNPEGSAERTATTSDMVAFMWRRFAESTDMPEVPDGHALSQEAALENFRATGNDSITWLGHASFLIRTGGKVILTDPFLTDLASPVPFAGPRRFVPPGIAIPDLPPIDILVVSHNHYEHLDAETVETLPNKARIDVVVPLGLGDFFRERGYEKVHEVDWHQSVQLDAVTVTGLPVIHFSRRGLFDRNETLWMGAAITSPGQRLFFSGDTGYGPVFSEIGERYGPFDAAMIAIGAYEPRSIMKPVHVNPEEAVRLGRDIGARRLIGMHWGTIVLTEEPLFEPPVRFRAAAEAAEYDDDETWVLKIGESRELPPGLSAAMD
jgi:L-ascorbate metabolism protein UlaG (beta-lactamase superfamily)